MPRGLEFFRKTVTKDLHRLPYEIDDSKSVLHRVSTEEIQVIRQYFDENHLEWYVKLKKQPNKKALHIKKNDVNKLPRSFLVYINHKNEIRGLIQLKGKKAGGVHESKSSEEVYVGAGSFRSVKYLLDLHSMEIFAETINYDKDHESELISFQRFNSKYINNMICYAQYNLKTITVSPYHKKGSLSEKTLERLTQVQKTRIVIQLLLGVKEIHDAGYVHNDLKLLNILLKDNNDALIIDLDGVTKQDGSEGRAARTIDYYSPDMMYNLLKQYQYACDLSVFSNFTGFQVLQHIERDRLSSLDHHPANDIWTLGCIFYEINHNGHSADHDFVLQKSTDLAKDRIYRGDHLQKQLLDYVAHMCLRPFLGERPAVDEVILFTFLLIARENFSKRNLGYQENMDLLEDYDGQNDEQARLKICELLFSEYVDLFFQLPMSLQRPILEHFFSVELQFNESNLLKYLKSSEKRFSVYYPDIQMKCTVFTFTSRYLDLYKRQVNKVSDYLELCSPEEKARVVAYFQNAGPHKYIINFINDSDRLHILLAFLEKFTITFKLSAVMADKKINTVGFLKTIIEKCSMHYVVNLFIEELYNSALNSKELMPVVKAGLWLFHHYKNQMLSLEQKAKYLKKLTEVALQFYPFGEVRYNLLLLQLLQDTFHQRTLCDVIRKSNNKQIALELLHKKIDDLSSKDILNWIMTVGYISDINFCAIGELGIFHWSIDQIRIFKAVREIGGSSQFSDEEKLLMLSRTFDAVYDQRNKLYPSRYGLFDAIGSAIFGAEKISHRGQMQLEDVQEYAFALLKKIQSDSQKIDLLRRYQFSNLFKINYTDGYCDKAKTYYQEWMDAEINRLRPVKKTHGK